MLGKRRNAYLAIIPAFAKATAGKPWGLGLGT